MSESEIVLHLQKERSSFTLLQNFLLERLTLVTPVETDEKKSNQGQTEKISPESFSNSWLRFLLKEFISLLTDDERWHYLIRMCEKEVSIAEAIKLHFDEVTTAYLGIIISPDEVVFEKAKHYEEPEYELLNGIKERRVFTLIKALESLQVLVSTTTKSEKMDTGKLSQIIALYMNSELILNLLKTQPWASGFLNERGYFLTKMSELPFWEMLEGVKHFHLPELLNRLMLVKTFLDSMVETEKMNQEKNLDISLMPELSAGYVVFQQKVLRELTILTVQLQSKIQAHAH